MRMATSVSQVHDSKRTLHGRELRRYSRHLLLPEFGVPGQEALVNARVAVIGAGGLGSPIVQYLAAAGVGHMSIIDPDVVEESNLQRQVIHSEAALGYAKVDSAKAAALAINSSLSVHTLHDAVRSSNILSVLQGHDLVLDGSDNFPTRYLVSDACEILNLPLVWGSILGFHGQVAVFFSDAGQGVTYRDLHPRPPRAGDVPNCAEAGVIGALVGVIGSTMAMEAIKVLSQVGRVNVGHVRVYDALNGTWDVIEVQRIPDRAAVSELEDLTLTCGYPALHEPVDAKQPQEDPVNANTPQGSKEPEVLSPSQARDEQERGRLILDIRNDDEVARGMLPGALHAPMDDLLAMVRTHTGTAGQVSSIDQVRGAIIHCQGGGRSARTQQELAQLGIDVADLAGGYTAAAPIFSPAPADDESELPASEGR